MQRGSSYATAPGIISHQVMSTGNNGSSFSVSEETFPEAPEHTFLTISLAKTGPHDQFWTNQSLTTRKKPSQVKKLGLFQERKRDCQLRRQPVWSKSSTKVQDSWLLQYYLLLRPAQAQLFHVPTIQAQGSSLLTPSSHISHFNHCMLLRNFFLK